MIDDVQALLKRWGRWVREEQDQPKGIGYPSQAIGAEAMMPPPSRKEHEQREADRLARVARRGGTYRTNPEGKPERVEPMVPMTQPSETRSSRPRSPDYEPAPAEMMECHHAVSSLPYMERRVVMERFVRQLSLRECSEAVSTDQGPVTVAQVRESLLRAEGHVRAHVARQAVA